MGSRLSDESREQSPASRFRPASILLTAAMMFPVPALAQDIVQAASLLDISGVSWVDGDVFLATLRSVLAWHDNWNRSSCAGGRR